MANTMTIPSFRDTDLQEIAEALADSVTHRELSDVFSRLGVQEREEGPKWQRILSALTARQIQDRCGNIVGAFIQEVMSPVRYVERVDEFSNGRARLNKILAFSGLHLGEDGKLCKVPPARTLTQAEERAERLKSELLRRKVHTDVLKFCRPELLQENYFHAVLEATKSVAQKIRDKTGLQGDGDEIVASTFGLKSPLLALNSLRTETEKSEQTGFANLLRGMFGTFRNVTGHAPKIYWSIKEQDALDLLSLVSYLHRRLDEAIQVPRFDKVD